MRKYFKWVFLLFPTILYTIFWERFYAHHTQKHSLLKRWKRMRGIIKKGNKVFKVKFFVEGMDKLPNERSYVMVPNHQSMIDPLLVMDQINDPMTFIAKKELEHTPFAGDGLRTINGLFLDRKDLRQEIRCMKIMEKSLKTQNLKWCIFPEGTRTKNSDYSLNEFKAGTFKYPMKTKTTIVPVAIYGSFRILPKNMHQKYYPVQISFLEPICYENYQNMSTQQLAEFVQNKIANKIKQLRIKDEELNKNL